MLHSADCVLLTVAIYHPWLPHYRPPGVDNPEHRLVRKPDVSLILLCPILVLLAETVTLLDQGQGQQWLLYGNPRQEAQFLLVFISEFNPKPCGYIKLCCRAA
jgi:hypothetical protein